ncbi:MAG: hypothetical protein KJN62_06130 [Deltaproteobacteria bacterium]|nr:hypothetical protein [Deltaproteobacteria bacterium]
MGIFLSFLPWIAFWVLSGRDNYQTAAMASVAIVIVLNLRDVRQRNIKILDLGTLAFFVLLAIASFSSDAVWIDHYAAPLSSAALFLIALVSILIRKPFTMQYAREQVDRKFWDTPGFYTTNRTISAVWSVSFAVSTVTSYMKLRHPCLLDWGIHIVVFVGAIKFTAWYPEYLRAKRESLGDGSSVSA